MEADRPVLVVLDKLADEVELLGGRIVERLRSSDVEGARSGRIRPEELRPLIEGTIRSAIEALREGRSPTDDELGQAATVGELRARQGFTLEGMLLGLRVGAREALDAVQRLAVEVGVDAATSIGLAAAFWDWVDAVSAEMASGHRRVELAMARQDQQQRAAFVHSLLFGSLSAQALAGGAAAYGLDLDAEHRPVRVRPSPDQPPEALERVLKPSLWSPGLLGTIDDDLVAVLPRLPDREIPVPAGVGPLAPLSAIAHSFQLASRALETAIAFDRAGYQALEDLALRPTVLAEDELGEILLRRYIEPVLRLGPFGEEVLRSLHVYIEHDQSVDASAKALIVHPNTLRHRLGRFEEETGASLRNVEQLTEIWWALARRELEHSPADRGRRGPDQRGAIVPQGVDIQILSSTSTRENEPSRRRRRSS